MPDWAKSLYENNDDNAEMAVEEELELEMVKKPEE